jgi:hypothetical protein
MKIDFIFEKFGEDSLKILNSFKSQQIKIPEFNIKNNSLVRSFASTFGNESIDYFKRLAGKRIYISNEPINQYIKFVKKKALSELSKKCTTINKKY